MCRFVIYKGQEPIRLEHLLTRPAHSIINQSFDSRLRVDMRRPINGDGFGVGYYPCDAEEDEELGPCVYCATTPAWNNINLERIASKTRSKMIFAHVRASTAGVLSETNCHPFVYHTLMFMHNGGVSYFPKIKRKLCDLIQEKYFLFIQGSTDSEACFALFLDCLERLGVNPADPKGQFPSESLEKALLNTIEILVKLSLEAAREAGISNPEPSLLNFAISDGESVVVSRYVSSEKEEAASLYYSTGTRFFEYEQGQYKMERSHRLNSIAMVASEPLTFERSDWIAIPTNTILTIRKNSSVLMKPIRDQFFVSDPTKTRRSDLMVKKGLASPLVEPSLRTQLGSQRGVPPLGREGRKPEVATV